MVKSNILTRSKKQKAFRLMEQNQLSEAKPLLEQVCKLERNDAESWFALGIIQGSIGDHLAAENSFRHTVKLLPENADALCNLGAALEIQGRYDEALDIFQQALAINDSDPVILENLASTLLSLGRFKKSIEYGIKTVKHNPKSIKALTNLGLAFLEIGEFIEALNCHESAIKINPSIPEPYNNLSMTQSCLRQYDDAILNAEHATKLNPLYAEAYNNLGIALKGKGLVSEGEENYKKAIELKPDYFRAYNNLADAYLHQGKINKALSSLERALGLNPGYELSHRNLIFYMNYVPSMAADVIYSEHVKWAEKHTALIERYPGTVNNPDPQRRLRIGYVSPDFKTHSVAYFFEPILHNHNKEQIETYCYAEVKRPDDTTKRLKLMANHWRSTVGLTDHEVAKLIHQDKIDILVDLAGHTADNRTLIFATKPAPIQISYLGYPNTTGMTHIDYRLTDIWADPEGQGQFHSEQLVRLPGGFLCYQPPVNCPDVALLPADSAGYVTFGSFNNLTKINSEVIALWSKVLSAISRSRLVIKNKSIQDRPTCERYLNLFVQQGIQKERIDLIGWLPNRKDHLGLYNRIDIGLDTFPYNGTTTTCEALWMGVPVITMKGDRHAGRVGTSLLKQLALDELIADNGDNYLTIAKHLANNKHRLMLLRQGLRQRMTDSPLCDAETFTANLEVTYRKMWHDYCNQVKN